MDSQKLVSRQYKEGVMNRHMNDELESRNAPIYTMFRHSPWDGNKERTVYTIVCDYGKGEVNNFFFETLEECLRVFRLLVAMD